LFEGRYKALLVDKQTYLLELARYIALNPVRAGLVSTPDAWESSSYRATAGLAAPPRFLTVDFLRRASGGRDGDLGAEDFARLVASASDLAAGIEALFDGAAAGSRPFKERVTRERQPATTSREVPIAHRMLGRPPLGTILGGYGSKAERDIRIRTAVLTHGYTKPQSPNTCASAETRFLGLSVPFLTGRPFRSKWCNGRPDPLTLS